MMKTIASGLLVLGLLTVQVSEANAFVCAAGAYRAGCVGPRGAVGVHRGYYGYRGGAVVRPAYGARCYWRAGVPRLPLTIVAMARLRFEAIGGGDDTLRMLATPGSL